MNKEVDKFLKIRDKFMPDMHLRPPGFTYCAACGPFTKNKQIIQGFKEPGDTKYIYRNELGKACFQHDMAYGDFKDLSLKRQSLWNCKQSKIWWISKRISFNGL